MKCEENVDVVRRMENLARKWHRGQFREGSGKVFHITHPRAVERQLEFWGVDRKSDPLPLCLAFGHDLLTKCGKSAEELLEAVRLRCEEDIARRIVSGIEALSFLPQGELSDEEYDRRKAEFDEGIAQKAPPEVLVVEMSDRICHARDYLRARRPLTARKCLERGRRLFDRADELPWAAAIKGTLAEWEGRIASHCPAPGHRLTEWMLNEKWKNCPLAVMKVYPVVLASVVRGILGVHAPGAPFGFKSAYSRDDMPAHVAYIFCGRSDPDDVDRALTEALAQCGADYTPREPEF